MIRRLLYRLLGLPEGFARRDTLYRRRRGARLPYGDVQ